MQIVSVLWTFQVSNNFVSLKIQFLNFILFYYAFRIKGEIGKNIFLAN